jgi:phosphomannomutase
MQMALMVGVSGVRGLVGETLTPTVALEFAQAYGTLLQGGRVVLARDSRPSGPLFAAAAAAGLMAAGCEVTDLGVVMTPTIGYTIRERGFAGGMSITASHNPKPWNGLKFLDALGVAPDPRQAAEIAGIRTAGQFALVREGFSPLAVDADAGQRHADAVRAACEADLASLRGTHVVVDSINGAGCRDTPGFLEALGCRVTHLNGEPTGDFAHEPEPTEANLRGLCARVRETGAAIGFAQDPDADRLAIVDEQGTYIGEEYTLALAVEAVLSRRLGPVAANLSTSRMIDDVAGRYGVPVHRTPVGEANVARGMLAHECVVGGEGNGGVIDPRICYVRDSLSAMSLVLQLMATTGKRVSELVAGLPRYASVKQKAAADRPQIDAAVEAVTKAFAEQKPNTSDGVRIDFAEGWVHLRASNTEPIVRLMAEAVSEDDAAALIERVRSVAGLA